MHNQHLKSISDLKKQVKRQQTLHLDSTTKIKDLDTGLKSMDENMTSLKKELDSTNQNLKNTRLQLESELMEHSITIIQNSTRITVCYTISFHYYDIQIKLKKKTLEYWRINGQRLISVLFFMLLRFKKSAWFVGLLWSGLKGVSSSTSSSSSIWKRRVYNCLQILSVGWIVYQFKAYTHFKQYFMVKRVLKNETD